MNCSLLADAMELLKISEASIAMNLHRKKFGAFVFDLLNSIEIIMGGMTRFIRPCVRFILYWAIGLLSIEILAHMYPLNQSQLNVWRCTIGIFSFVLTAFALPNTYVTDALSDSQIELVVSQMRLYSGHRQIQTAALLDTIDEFHNRALARVTAFQWIMAALWGVATYIFSQYAGIVMRVFPGSASFQEIANGGMRLLIFALFSLLIMWIIFGYKRSIDRVFRLSRLAIRQMSLESTKKVDRLRKCKISTVLYSDRNNQNKYM